MPKKWPLASRSSDKRGRAKQDKSADLCARFASRGRWLGLGAGIALLVFSRTAIAACSPPGPTLTPGVTVTCSGTQTTQLGQGPGADNVTVIANDGATISVLNANAISLGNNATITLGTSVPAGGSASNAPVLIQTTTNGGANGGQYGKGDNTIEFNNNSTLIINKTPRSRRPGARQPPKRSTQSDLAIISSTMDLSSAARVRQFFSKTSTPPGQVHAIASTISAQ